MNNVMWFYNNSTHRLKLLAGTPGPPADRDGTGTAARLYQPANVAVSADGNIANIAESGTCCVRQVDVTGKVISVCVSGCAPH